MSSYERLLFAICPVCLHIIATKKSEFNALKPIVCECCMEDNNHPISYYMITDIDFLRYVSSWPKLNMRKRGFRRVIQEFIDTKIKPLGTLDESLEIYKLNHKLIFVNDEESVELFYNKMMNDTFTGLTQYSSTPENDPLYDEKKKALDDYKEKYRIYRCKRFSEDLRNRSKSERIQPPTIKCPTCGSTACERISNWDRSIDTMIWSIASNKMGKTFECKSCHYTW